MEQSILKSTKQKLGIAPGDGAFDLDVIEHVNSVFSDLLDLGIGDPESPFEIEDENPTWAQYFGPNPNLNRIKTYIFLRVRMLFDPPTSGYAITAMEKQIEKMEWRINQKREETEWEDPIPPSNVGVPDDIFGDTVVLDGGDA